MNTQIDVSSSFYLDTQSLEKLKLQAAQDQRANVKAAAQQFETVFMGMMLKSMRDATPQDGLFDNEQTKMYNSMLDQQLALTMSKKGMGLAELMARQLDPSSKVKAPNPFAATQPASAAAPKPVAAAPVAPAPMTVAPMTVTPAPGNSRDFVASMLPAAQAASRESGIPAQFMIGQAALESGWGRRELKSADGQKSFNLFGIKADKNWKGPVVSSITTEYVNGVPKKVAANFRAYSSYAESFQDYARLISGNSRYAQAAQAQDPVSFARGLQAGGYATDPGYAEKLRRVFSSDAMQMVG